MSEDQVMNADEANEVEAGEATAAAEMLEQLKNKATLLGISFSPRIGVDALRLKIAEAMEDKKEEPAAAPKASSEAAMRAQMMQDANRLVRLRITNLNPLKKDLAGEIFTVANKYMGIVKKYIPYGEATDNGYHVPFVIYEQLKSRKFLSLRTRTVKGQIQIDQRWVNEFALEVLEPLTQKELDKLAAAQAASNSISDN